jgi:hypothetical protein
MTQAPEFWFLGGTGSVDKLPILETASQAYRLVFGQPVSLIIALAVPFLLWNLLLFEVWPVIAEGLGTVFPPAEAQGGGLALTLQVVLSLLVILAFWIVPETLFAVMWHRFVLLGPVAAKPRPITLWRSRHWRFFGYLWIVTFVMTVPMDPGFFFILAVGPGSSLMSPAMVAMGLVGVILSMAGVYVIARLSLVLPASAIEFRCRFRESWRYTRGQGWRLIFATLLGGGPYIVLEILRASLAETEVVEMGDGFNFVDRPAFGSLQIDQSVMMLGFLLSTAITITVLSLAFRHCTGWRPPSEGDRQEPVVKE